MPQIIKYKIILACLAFIAVFPGVAQKDTTNLFCGHKVVLDNQEKLLPPKVPSANAYDYFLRLRWGFIQNHVPLSPGPAPRSQYPQYYFYCAFVDTSGKLEPDGKPAAGYASPQAKQ